MTTPHRYAIIKLDRQNRVNVGPNVYVQHSNRAPEWIGEISEDTTVIWIDTKDRIDGVMEWLHNTFPRNSYVFMETVFVSAVPFAPAQRAVYTDAGLIPA